MSLLADAIQPLIVRDLATIAGRMTEGTLPDALIAPLVGYDLNFDNVENAILVDFGDAAPVALALASDSCRLACASFQTITLASGEMMQRDSMAWSLIKLYYSAFYAGNALIRLMGESSSYFDDRHIGRLNEIAAALGRTPAFNVTGGLYRCVVSSSGTELRCVRARTGIGGSHEAFWKIFGARVQQIAESILTSGVLGRSDAQAVFAQLEGFRDLIRRKANYSWLSVIRNELQYRQEFRVWFPAQLRARERERLSRLSTHWTRDPMQIDLSHGHVLGQFVACCTFVVALCNVVLTRIAERSAVGSRSFVCLGPMAFLNDRAVA